MCVYMYDYSITVICYSNDDDRAARLAGVRYFAFWHENELRNFMDQHCSSNTRLLYCDAFLKLLLIYRTVENGSYFLFIYLFLFI